MLSGSPPPPGLKSRSYTPTNNLFSEQNTPDTLQMTPVLRMHASVRHSPHVSRPLSSLRWQRHGSTSVMAAPVTLPVRPISRENLGTIRARRYAVTSRAARTSRAGRETPEPSASVGASGGHGLSSVVPQCCPGSFRALLKTSYLFSSVWTSWLCYGSTLDHIYLNW